MIWKTLILLTIALCVLGDGHHAVSEQIIKIHHKHHHKEHHHEEHHDEHHKDHHGHHGGQLSHIGSNKPEHHEEYAWSYPSYEFSYKVHDPHTHDIKGQHESREGDDVKGEYWLVEPDGRKRTVTYHADKHTGFHATVHYSDDHHHIHDHHEEDHHDEHHHHEHKNAEEGGEKDGGEENRGGEEGGESEEERNNEPAAVTEEVEENRSAEESRGREEGRWIHDRFWGHHADGRHRDHRHHDHDHKHNHRDENRHRYHEHNHHYRDEYHDNRHHAVRGDGGHKYEEEHKDISIIHGLGSYGRREGRERAEWHGHDDRRGRDEGEESRKSNERRVYPSHKTGAIVRENYIHPRFYRHSKSQRENTQ